MVSPPAASDTCSIASQPSHSDHIALVLGLIAGISAFELDIFHRHCEMLWFRSMAWLSHSLERYELEERNAVTILRMVYRRIRAIVS